MTMAVTATVLMITSALGLQPPPVMTASRPCAVRRCAPPLAQQDGWVDFDESGDECVISNAGATCMGGDVAGPPVGWTGQTAPGPMGMPRSASPRARRSPGMVPFMDRPGAMNVDDVRKPFDEPERGSDSRVPPQRAAPVHRPNWNTPFGSVSAEQKAFELPENRPFPYFSNERLR